MVVSDGGHCLSDRHYEGIYMVLHAYLYQVTLAFLLPVTIVFICNISVLRKICQVTRRLCVVRIWFDPFTDPACNISGLSDKCIHTVLQTV